MATEWLSEPPNACDLCRRPIRMIFIDGKTSSGPWGNMCPECHKSEGGGLGTGLGQRYEKQDDGRWEKTAG
ncbi:hypothetical protein CMI37_27200 [Candidatus Pacearchaeota archaeon]|nr:hypothetical protein [Candidatus Pacearchaeota archaeon]